MNNILTMQNVSYQYEGAKKTVLKDINAEFEAGKLYVIMGKSGAGKSTILSLLSGLDTATEGSIQYEGADLRRTGPCQPDCVNILKTKSKIPSNAPDPVNLIV